VNENSPHEKTSQDKNQSKRRKLFRPSNMNSQRDFHSIFKKRDYKWKRIPFIMEELILEEEKGRKMN